MLFNDSSEPSHVWVALLLDFVGVSRGFAYLGFDLKVRVADGIHIMESILSLESCWNHIR